jgi:glycosyltransferase involved in cell wall biosynthesis
MKIEKKNILVSICCITYNHANYIRECLNGFLGQRTNFEYEILIHDDASTDGTSEIIMEYALRHPDKIKPIIQRENKWSKGQRGMNIKYNFSRAKGKFIALCDGDDFWIDPLKLQKQVDFLNNNKDYIVTYHNAKIVNEKGEIISKSKLKDKSKKDLSALQLMQGEVPPTLTVCFRNIIEDFPPESEVVTNEDAFTMSMLGNYGKGKYVDIIEPSCYRIHEGGIWSLTNKDKKHISKVNTYQQLHNYYKRVGNIEMTKYFKKRVRDHKKVLISFYLKRNNYFAAGNYLLQLLKD